MVARDGQIREANQDSAAARRARIGPHRSESIEPSTRGLTIRGPQKRTPARGRGLCNFNSRLSLRSAPPARFETTATDTDDALPASRMAPPPSDEMRTRHVIPEADDSYLTPLTTTSGIVRARNCRKANPALFVAAAGSDPSNGTQSGSYTAPSAGGTPVIR